METLYDMLGARPDDDAESLKNAFRKAAKANHPDRHADDPEAVERFRRIAVAYDVLRDAKQRAAYDRLLELQRRPLHATARRVTSHPAYQFAFNAITGVVVGIMLAVGGYIVSARIYGMTGYGADGITASQPPRMVAVKPATRADTAKEEAPSHGPAHPLQVLVTQRAAAPAVEGRGAREAVQGPSGPEAARQTTGFSTPAINPTGPKAATGDPGRDRDRGTERAEQPQSTEQKTAGMSMSQDEICKRNAAQLADLRISQGRDEVIRFERELGCEKLRPQVIRLRESVDPQ
jgi:curved DNA-binding protein CbpA